MKTAMRRAVKSLSKKMQRGPMRKSTKKAREEDQ